MLESIESPFEQFQEQMQDLKRFLADGLIDPRQFDQLSANASKAFFGEDKLASLNLVGSNEELQLRAKQSLAASGTSGAPDTKDVPKKQLNEQKETNQKLDTLASLIRQMIGNDSVISIPVV